MKLHIVRKTLILGFVILLFAGCKEDEEVHPRTRLFKPVLAQNQLIANNNTIIVNISREVGALSYQIEVSRDTFNTIDYSFEVDTSYFVIDESLIGEELFWNTIYQVRAQAYADNPQYNSLKSELGNVRTEKFPSNLLVPASNDVIDTKAKVKWQPIGDAVDEIRIYNANDFRLERPVLIISVSAEENTAGEKIVTNLLPETGYQIAIYSNGVLRGWENYSTLASKFDKSAPNVIDLSESIDPDAVSAAYDQAQDGDVIIMKKGVTYNFPTSRANKSITFVGDLGFEENKAGFYTTGNWNVEEGSMIDHIRFIDLELAGEDFGGDYIINPSGFATETRVNEFTIEDCYVHDFRGIVRIRNQMFIDNYNIRNTVVHTIGGYGIITCDTDGDGQAAVGNVTLENSTFSHVIMGIQTRQNVQSVTIDGCTFYNFPESGRQIFRFRGADGFDEAINGISISNSIFGHSWDQSLSENYEINAIDGLSESNFSITNVYATSEFAVRAGDEIPGLPTAVYSGADADLWADPENWDFNFKDTGFSGRTDSGDPRWRTEF